MGLGLGPANHNNATSFPVFGPPRVNLVADGAAAAGAITPLPPSPWSADAGSSSSMASSAKVSTGTVVMKGLYTREGDGVVS